MKERDDDMAFEARAKAHFDDSVDALDGRTLSRLNRSRQAALAELAPRRRATRWARWLPATGVVAAALVTVMVLRGPDAGDRDDTAVTASDFELLLDERMDEQSLEMLEELEFYSWLDTVDAGPGGDVG